MDISRIRNFSIIAHVDHGKSTLADRLLELTGLIPAGTGVKQYLDRMELEQERGITIKAQSVRLPYRASDDEDYVLNLIDTPGHVDFSYEVSRSLSACEGALLVVDAAKGVEAQTVANAYLAVDLGLEIIPVINKIDLPSARVEEVKLEIQDVLGLDADEALCVSAKHGTGVEAVLEAIVRRLPPPRGDRSAPLQALLFDSWFDTYTGTACLVRVMHGELRTGQRIRLMAVGMDYEVDKLHVIAPEPVQVDRLGPGEVGLVVAGIKQVDHARVGDTITDADHPAESALPGFRELKPMVFAGLYPSEPGGYGRLRDAVEKLKLNDASFSFEPESSVALGFGFRCGFLGLLHMEIVQERLEREFELELVTTAPTVRYRAVLKDGSEEFIDNPTKLPEPLRLDRMEEPVIRATIHMPDEGLGNVLKLCDQRRGAQIEMSYISKGRVMLEYELPLAEVVYDFYDKLKSTSRGYASMDYELAGYRPAPLVKLDILVNGQAVDALSLIVHKDRAYERGKELAGRLARIIPRQLFEVVIQAAVGSRVIARESVKPLRKNVTSKCYGGDITRKRKLLEKQKEGKRRMKMMGNVEIPQEAFMAVLKVEE